MTDKEQDKFLIKILKEILIELKDNAEYINRLYLTFMNRPADTAGFNDWMNRMNGGASREDVFAGFAGSQEWAGICSSYGILK